MHFLRAGEGLREDALGGLERVALQAAALKQQAQGTSPRCLRGTEAGVPGVGRASQDSAPTESRGR